MDQDEQMIRPIVVEPRSTHNLTVILLHGRGSTGQEFQQELFESTGSDGQTLVESLPHVKWLFPTATQQFSTVFQESMNEWFDIYSLSDPEQRRELQVPGLRQSIRRIHHILDQELAVLSPDRVVLGGISQGCATAVHALLSQNVRLGGFLGVCGWIPFRSNLTAVVRGSETHDDVRAALINFYDGTLGVPVRMEAAQSARGKESVLLTKALISHGLDDDVVSAGLGKQLRDVLLALGLNVSWKAYDECGHWFQEPDGIDDMVAFLSRVSND